MKVIEPALFSVPFRGAIKVPGSKSLTNRLLPLAALSGGTIRLLGALKSEDTEVMILALRKLGIEIDSGPTEGSNYTFLDVRGAKGRFPAPGDIELDCKNSGTTLRFLTALAALRNGHTVLTGTPRMKERPLADLIDTLRQMGVSAEYLEKEGFPPVAVIGKEAFDQFQVEVSGKTSSQFLSALLLLSVFTGQEGNIRYSKELVSAGYFQMTLRLLQKFGAGVETTGDAIRILPKTLALPAEFSIEGDATAATYPLAIAAATGGEIVVQNLYSTSIQGDIGFAEVVLQKMGCLVDFTANSLKVKSPKTLLPLGTIDLNTMPDAAMTAVVLAAYTKGFSRIEGLSTLQHKESDRLKALVSNLRRMGAEVRGGEDFIEIEGDPQNLHGAEIETFDDHRIAMCFSVLGSVIPGVKIQNPECVAKTYPTYWEEYEEWRKPLPVSASSMSS